MDKQRRGRKNGMKPCCSHQVQQIEHPPFSASAVNVLNKGGKSQNASRCGGASTPGGGGGPHSNQGAAHSVGGKHALAQGGYLGTRGGGITKKSSVSKPHGAVSRAQIEGRKAGPPA